MITINKQYHVPCDIDSDILWLKNLLKDLENMTNGIFPDPRQLAAFPKIENWILASRRVPCLFGTIPGSCRIGDKPARLTTDLWVHAPAMGFARTLTNFFALGEPGPEQDPEID